MKKTAEIEISDAASVPDEIRGTPHPVLLKGLAVDWPLVKAAQESDDAADAYLRSFYNDTPVTISAGGPEVGGRIFYTDDYKGLNFRTLRGRLDGVLDELRRYREEEQPPVYYMGSTTVDHVLPGFREQNDLAFEGIEPSIRIWIGNRTRIAAHYDIPDNIACVAAGRRRFTLFPPEQLKNLYIGPLDLTPAGQSISLVDFHEPDFERFPRFREALEHAQVADMEPGDALFIPSMWWHHVEALDALNILVNYWWRDVPAYLGTPLDALNHALLSIRDLPEEQRAVWRDVFEHYVFNPGDATAAHIPEAARGVLSPITDDAARRLRALLIRNLNR